MPQSTPHDPGVIAAVLVSLIGVLGLVATYATTGVTGAAYEITDTRLYVPHSETFCPDPAKPVPVFRQLQSRIGNINSVLVECVAPGEAIVQSGSRFRPERNRNKESTSAYADHFTRQGTWQKGNGMLWAGY